MTFEAARCRLYYTVRPHSLVPCPGMPNARSTGILMPDRKRFLRATDSTTPPEGGVPIWLSGLERPGAATAAPGFLRPPCSGQHGLGTVLSVTGPSSSPGSGGARSLHPRALSGSDRGRPRDVARADRDDRHRERRRAASDRAVPKTDN